MQKNKRRIFLKHSAMAVAAMLLPTASILAVAKKYKPKLSFSTLGCPNWNLQTIIKFAAENDYQGVEIRTIQKELDLTKCPDFSSTNINVTKRMFAESNLIITDLGSSSTMHFTDKVIRQKNIDEGKRFIDLAEKLDCPYVRVFPNNLPANENPKATLEIIIDGLNELGNYSNGCSVKVLMETHGDVVKTADILYIMQNANQQKVGLIWDFLNMWSVTKEPPTDVYNKLKKYIYHVHVKDAKWINGKEQYTLLGNGEGPVKEAIQLLAKEKFMGFYSFEWEKMWHPEIEEPEIALAHYPGAIKKYF